MDCISHNRLYIIHIRIDCITIDIDTYILKLVVDEILPAMTHVINLSIQQSIFPSTWKVAMVIPLFKKGDSLELPTSSYSSYHEQCP